MALVPAESLGCFCLPFIMLSALKQKLFIIVLFFQAAEYI